ncbi:MAG TPA: adenylate/guanylate cyclase domain-containing protein [Acidimicrobiales bacterium]|nr:adenylate/guanylate cyclase domain-containing protein [Acidimicrobiales bacterium]
MSPTTPPRTHYARSGNVRIAYQVVGDGPRDVVFAPGVLSHLDLIWEDRILTKFFTRLGSFSRLVLFDKRGTGLSDRDVGSPDLEERIDDLRAVMDAVGSERASLVGYSDGGSMCMLFAATYPERTEALVLAMTSPRFTRDDDFPCGALLEQNLELGRRVAEEHWGEGLTLSVFGRSVADQSWAQEVMGRWERLSASPSGFESLIDTASGIDVRPVLSSINVPTLVTARLDDGAIPVEASRYLAQHIAGAKYFEQPGDHLLGLGDVDILADEIEEFLTGARPVGEPDRVLATVLFTDIVESTAHAARLGDRRWRRVLDEHDSIVRRRLAEFSGREVKTTGDGFLATFDGPARAIRCACAIRAAMPPLEIEVRAGLHTGEVELVGDDVAGIAVHIGQRVSAHARPGEVLVSRTVKDLVAGSEIRFVDHGEHELKGVPGRWNLLAVEG